MAKSKTKLPDRVGHSSRAINVLDLYMKGMVEAYENMTAHGNYDFKLEKASVFEEIKSMNRSIDILRANS